MAEFLQSYGIWILGGIIVLLLVSRIGRMNRHEHASETGTDKQDGSGHRHSGGCCG